MPSLDDLMRKPDPTPQTPPPVPADPTRASAYGRQALNDEITRMLAVPVGSGRNHALNTAAFRMGQLIAGGAIDEATVVAELGAADGGLDYKPTRDTIASGIASGKKAARYVPADHREASSSTSTGTASAVDPFADVWLGELPPRVDGTATTSEPHDPTDTTAAPTSGTGSTTLTGASAAGSPADPAQADRERYELAVRQEAATQRMRRDARRLVEQEDALRDFRVPPFRPTLADELAIVDEPLTFAVDTVFPTGANVLLTAQYKTGKTTLINNLARAFVDGVPFLGRYEVTPPEGRVVIFNYEVSDRQYRHWLREMEIQHPDRIAVLNLRGYRLPLDVPYVEQWVVDYLRAAEAAVWIVDPFARASVGIEENSNSEAGVWLDTLDVIKQRAGVSELVLPTHTGKEKFEPGQEQSRGATRLPDWCDVQWFLTRDDSNVRYFRATGRDVETDESALAFDESTRTLSLTGGTRIDNAEARLHDAILTCVRNRPGINAETLFDGTRSMMPGGKLGRDRFNKAVKRLAFERRIEQRGSKPILHFPGIVDPFDS